MISQVSKLKKLSVDVADVVMILNTKVLAFLDTPYEQLFIELSMKAVGVQARFFESKDIHETKDTLKADFNTRDGSIKLLILTYATGSLCINLPKSCWYIVHFCRSVTHSVEDQGSGPIRQRNSKLS